jgi:hypothetical protein
MNYFDHNDRKNADARIRAQIHNAERAKAQDFDGTLTMSKYDVFARRTEGGFTRLIEHSVERMREPRCEFSANRAMAPTVFDNEYFDYVEGR